MDLKQVSDDGDYSEERSSPEGTSRVGVCRSSNSIRTAGSPSELSAEWDLDEVPPTTDGFEVVGVIGHGSYGFVSEVREKLTRRHFAQKTIAKAHLGAVGHVRQAKAERDALARLSKCRNIVQIYQAWQDAENLYFITGLARNGDLEGRLRERIAFANPGARLLLGQILLALAFMHSRGVVHLDLKPGNILLDKHNRVRVSDFGCALHLDSDDVPASIGSPDYVSPEVLAGERPTAAADLWAFGCIVFAIFTGGPPFRGHSLYDTFERIRLVRYHIPEFVPKLAADLVRKLLVRIPEDRIGAGQWGNGYAPIKEDPFFRGIDWDTLPTEKIHLIAFPPAVANREREMSEKMAGELEGEEIVQTAKVAHEGKEAELCITDMARLVVRVEGKVVQAVQISDTLSVTAEEGVLTAGNGHAGFSVEMDEADAYRWIELLHEIIEDD